MDASLNDLLDDTGIPFRVVIRYSYVLREEWSVMTTRYPYDHVITVTKETIDGDECRFTTSPGM